MKATLSLKAMREALARVQPATTGVDPLVFTCESDKLVLTAKGNRLVIQTAVAAEVEDPVKVFAVNGSLIYKVLAKTSSDKDRLVLRLNNNALVMTADGHKGSLRLFEEVPPEPVHFPLPVCTVKHDRLLPAILVASKNVGKVGEVAGIALTLKPRGSLEVVGMDGYVAVVSKVDMEAHDPSEGKTMILPKEAVAAVEKLEGTVSISYENGLLGLDDKTTFVQTQTIQGSYPSWKKAESDSYDFTSFRFSDLWDALSSVQTVIDPKKPYVTFSVRGTTATIFVSSEVGEVERVIPVRTEIDFDAAFSHTLLVRALVPFKGCETVSLGRNRTTPQRPFRFGVGGRLSFVSPVILR